MDAILKLLQTGNWHVNADFAVNYLNGLNVDSASAKELMDIRDQRTLYTLVSSEMINGLRMHILDEKAKPGSILYLPLVGLMTLQTTWYSWGMNLYEDILDAAKSNPNIKGAYIYSNSGGGESLAGQKLMSAVNSFASLKPVVTHFDTMDSAALHGLLPSWEIIATGAGSESGSIGTMIQVSKAFLKYFKDEIVTIIAKGAEDKNKPLIELANGNEAKMNAIATEYASFFRNDVKQYRSIDDTALTGKTYRASEAKKIGLIDSIGDREYALSRLNFYIKNQK